LGERFEKIGLRTLTIVIGIPIILLIIHLGGIIFYISLSIIALLAALELWQIFKKKDYQPALISGFFATMFFLFQKTLSESILFDSRLVFTLLFFLIIMENFLLKPQKYNNLLNITLTIFIAIYLGHLLSFLIEMRELPNGKILLIFTLFTTWLSDVVAYLIGTKFGKRHPFPYLSPNKTLAGSLSGILGGGLCGLAFYLILPIKPSLLVIIGIMAALFGQLGDLFESMIKRNFGVKDSGHLLPGHGGILDCMDSVLFSVPILYYYFSFFLINKL